MNVEQEMAEIIRTVNDNGRASNQEEFENEFEFEATEQGWTPEQVKEAIDSPWFPQFDE